MVPTRGAGGLEQSVITTRGGGGGGLEQSVSGHNTGGLGGGGTFC